MRAAIILASNLCNVIIQACVAMPRIQQIVNLVLKEKFYSRKFLAENENYRFK